MAYHAHFHAGGPRDKYTGTHGRSGLAGAGTTTRGPDGRVETLRPCAHAYVYTYVTAEIAGDFESFWNLRLI